MYATQTDMTGQLFSDAFIGIIYRIAALAYNDNAKLHHHLIQSVVGTDTSLCDHSVYLYV